MNRVEATAAERNRRQLRVMSESGLLTGKDRVPPSLHAAYFTRMALSNFAASVPSDRWYGGGGLGWGGGGGGLGGDLCAVRI